MTRYIDPSGRRVVDLGPVPRTERKRLRKLRGIRADPPRATVHPDGCTCRPPDDDPDPPPAAAMEPPEAA